MNKVLFFASSLAWSLCAFVPLALAQTVKVDGMTVDLFLSGNPSDPTVMYFPGCNGKDTFGAKYQDFHVKKMAKAWDGKVNIVQLQLVNDITHGMTDGMCFWSVEQNKKVGAESFEFAKKVGHIASSWVMKQPWYNGNLHFFGFSYGGRVSLMVNFIAATKGQFKTVTGIWPLCRKEYPIKANAPHTPTRLYSTEKDPLSDIGNCRSFYPNGGGDMIDVVTYAGSEHSWMTHPDLKYARVWWPNHKIWSESKYIESYAEKTWTSWVSWAKCIEGSQACN
jgi:dienelactone hydrolase